MAGKKFEKWKEVLKGMLGGDHPSINQEVFE